MNKENFQPETDSDQSEAENQFIPSCPAVWSERITFQDIRDHVTGPVISVALHIILLSLLMTLFISDESPDRVLAPVEYMDLPITPLIDKIPDVAPPDRTEPVPDRDIPQEMPTASTDSPSTETVVDPNEKPGTQTSMDDPGPAMQSFPEIANNGSVLRLPSLPGQYGGRNDGTIRKILVNQSAPETDIHVKTALDWLKDHQNADGSWGEDKGKQPALTGLATLAFLGRGVLPMSQDFGYTLVKALRKLVEFSNSADPNGVINGDGNGYCHPIVAYAISEAFTLTRIQSLEDSMNKMVSVMVQGQNKYGSYNYRYRNNPEEKTGEPRCDLSYAGWNFQALKASFAAGSSVSGIENALEKSKEAIQKVHGAQDGSFCYGMAKNGGGSISMTSVGTLSLQLLNAGKNPAAVNGLKWIENANGGKHMNSAWKDNSNSPWALYTWYYQTQALFQHAGGKGDSWNKWNDKFLKGSLLKEQERDGHWSSPYEKYGASRNGQGHGEGTGSVFKDSSLDLNVYSTSLCCLMLEVYYRLLPTFKTSSSEEGKMPAVIPGEDRLIIQ